ncbi:MAG: hypothetical protein C0424_10115 [Sphingobacteriaceae bacterium]|nr:hypothetical protein [Sphingobacteriaceae bacterium]
MFTFIKKMALTGSMVLLGAGGVGAQQQIAQQHINRFSLLQPFVPEGVLVERSPASFLRNTLTLDPDRYAYQRQDTSHWNHFVEFYRFWQPASYQMSRFPLSADTLTDAAEKVMYGGSIPANWQQRQIQNEVVLGAMHFNYREFADNALDSMYVYYDEQVDKYRLGLGSITFTDTVWTDPNNLNAWSIQTFTRTFHNQTTLQRWSVTRPFFLVAAHTQSVNVMPGEPVRFTLPTELFFGAWSGLQLQLNFDNGQGFVPVSVGQTIAITYTTPGKKWLKYRLVNADGGVVTGQNGVISLNVGIMRLGAPTQMFFSNQQTCISFPGVSPGSAVAFVKTAPQNQGQLRKPFILVEGIEMESIVKGSAIHVKANENGFGDLNWSNISSGNFGPGREHIAELTVFLDSINRAGYDIVFVDFYTNRARIEANAMALASIIEQINHQLQANGSNRNLEVVGASMGGLIARVALRQMELQGCCHNVKLFTTYATPHMGANVPLAMQLGLKDGAYRLNFLGFANDVKLQYDLVLNSPAARQMLYYHAESDARNDRTHFADLIQNLGWPLEPRKAAATNGSMQGLLQRSSEDMSSVVLSPGMQLFLQTHEVWVPTNFPLPNNARNYRAAGTNGMYLSRNEGFVMPHSPNAVTNALLYRAGKDVNSNLSDAIEANLTYVRGLFRVLKRSQSVASAAAANPVIAPLILAAGAVKILQLSREIDASLQHQFNANINSNLSFVQSHATFPTIGVDYAPGDFNDGKAERSKSIFSKSSFFVNSTFVPTTSSLSISDLNILLPINQASIKSIPNSFIGLEAIYVPQDVQQTINQKHVFVNDIVSSQIQSNQKTSVSSFQNNRLVESINISRPIYVNNTLWAMNADVELAPWRVGNGGHLGINRNLPVNLNGQPILASNRPTPNFHFVTKTSTFDCDSVPVVIENGGTMELGEIQPGNALTTEVYFRQASSLSLSTGSTLRINNRSRLIIERGSTLFVHPGATIVLDGDSAILEIQGRVVLVGNAVFGFTGSGFVRVNQTTGVFGNRWTFGQGSSISLVGSGRNDKVLEIVGDCRLLDTAAVVEIRNARVELMASARLNVHGKVNFENVHFTGPGTRAHHGVLVHGQPQLRIHNCLFSNGLVGLSANLLTYNGTLSLEQVIFNNNQTGLETFGRSANLTHCQGRLNTVFWRAYDIEGTSRVRNCHILSNQEGIHVMGQHGAQLEILESRLDSNVRAVMTFGDLKLKPYCSSFSNNTFGIYAGNTHVLLGGNANNTLRNNHQAIYLEEVDNLFLVNGYNDFSGSDWYITGRFTGIAHNYLSTIPNVNGFFLNVANNRMPLVQQQLPIDLEDGDGISVLATQWTFMSSIPLACVRIASADYDYWVLSSSQSTIPVEVGGVSKTLPSALLDAVQLVSKNEIVANPQDLVAVQQFHEIFQSMRNQLEVPLNKEEKLMVSLGLTRMIEAVSNAYRYALLQPARGDDEFPLSNAIEWTVEEIQHRLSDPDVIADAEATHLLKLKLAHVYRIGEYYKQALMVLEEIVNAQLLGTDVHTQAIYWRCICEVEMSLVKGEISAEEFELLRMPCLQQIPEMRKANRIWTMQQLFDAQSSKTLDLKVYPNPASEKVHLEQMADNGAAKIKLANIQGQVLRQIDWNNPYEVFTIDVDNLPAGMYVLEVYTSNGKWAKSKFVKK